MSFYKTAAVTVTLIGGGQHTLLPQTHEKQLVDFVFCLLFNSKLAKHEGVFRVFGAPFTTPQQQAAGQLANLLETYIQQPGSDILVQAPDILQALIGDLKGDNDRNARTQAALIKLVFSKLATALLTVKVGSKSSKTELLSDLSESSIKRMNRAQRFILFCLCSYLRGVADHHKTNQMTVSNLAKIFVATLQPETDAPVTTKSAQQFLKKSASWIGTLEALIREGSPHFSCFTPVSFMVDSPYDSVDKEKPGSGGRVQELLDYWGPKSNLSRR